MLNIYKHYNFNLNKTESPEVRSGLVSFSSYPAFLSSEDDFYITGSQLVVLETTNEVFNLSLYSVVKPQTVMSWIRVIVANRMANSGSEWTEIFARFNSGTYNNQWMIIDYKLADNNNGAALVKDNTLWIGSQLPGYFESADVSYVINQQGYWPSYNVPFFPNIYRLSGYQDMYNKYGNVFSYEFCPRANIFRQRQKTVNDLKTYQQIVRYNDWQHDPLSLDCPINQIASRADLTPVNSTVSFCPRALFGAINGKITSSNMVKERRAAIIGGPTHQSLPPFSWSNYPTAPHYGQPTVFNFDWIITQPSN